MQNRPKQNDPRRAKLWELREQRERTLVKIAYDEMNQEEKEKNETHFREIQAEIQSLHNAIEKTEADRYWNEIEDCMEEGDMNKWWEKTINFRKDPTEVFPPIMSVNNKACANKNIIMEHIATCGQISGQSNFGTSSSSNLVQGSRSRVLISQMLKE